MDAYDCNFLIVIQASCFRIFLRQDILDTDTGTVLLLYVNTKDLLVV